MAKEISRTSFSKARIEQDEVTKDFIITEVTKDSVCTYNLSEKIREYMDIDGVSLTIAKDAILEGEPEL